MPPSTPLEPHVQRIGRELFAQVKEQQKKLKGGWWNTKMMDFALQNEALKVQLFRFTDVLPSLRSNQEVGRHLKEYFDAPGQKFPGFLSWGASLAAFSSLAAYASAVAIRKSVEDMAKIFISGEGPKEALRAVEDFRKRGLAFTLDLLGEAVVSEAEAEAYAAKYRDVLEELAKHAPKWKPNPVLDRNDRAELPRINLSVKLSSLYSQLDPIDPARSLRGVEARLVPLLRRARELNAFVNVDMEDYRLKDLTLALFKELAGSAEFRDWPDLGIVVQAYLKDSAQDLKDLAAWAQRRGAPVTVRLVKGAYWDYETIVARQHGWPIPVYTRKHETDANFERCAEILLASHPHLETAIASHNIRSVAHALAVHESLGRPKEALEFQTLYGMADSLKLALAARGHRMRVYTPFGELLPGMAYLVRRLLENTANESFLRQGFVEGASEEKLLADPAALPPGPGLASPKTVSTIENEPDAAFHLKAEREAFAKALETVRGRLGASYKLVVEGKELDGEAGFIESRDPADRARLVGRVASASVAQADAAVAAAKAAAKGWRDTPVARRAEILRKAAELMRKEKFELAAWEVFECAKPWREADGDVGEAIDFLEYYARRAVRLMALSRRNPVPGEIDEDYYEPRGVCAVIAPWNFPLAILCGMTAAALATGNTVLMKPAEQSPVIAAHLMRLLKAAGVPDGVVQFLPGPGETVGARLVEHPHVDLIVFTGSKAVGLKINETAAKTREGQAGVKKVVTEMGGKNAIIVDSDADLDEAVAGVAYSAFGYAGQKCSACSRAIVVGDAYAPFVERLLEAVRSLHVGGAEDPGCVVPPVIDDEAQQRLLKAIEAGRKEAKLGAQADVTELAKKGSFVPPTVFLDVPPAAMLAQEELFGPVLSVMPAPDFDTALHIALDVPYALTGGLYSRSPGNIEKAREGFRVGNFYINRGCTGAKVERQPFGGFRFSGIGSKAGGPDYLLQFVNPRTVTENTMRRGFAVD
ncbi:MAG: proline dehydrogenase family protein [Planctomycetota bacterium]|nr:proline dehydrogenase family protein [Planctomycetota bacterium]